MQTPEARPVSIAIYGACHAGAIEGIIKKSVVDQDALNVFPVPACYVINEEQFSSLINHIRDLDLLIYQPISASYRDGQFSTEKFSSLDKYETESVAVQYFHFEIYRPYMSVPANGLIAPPFTYIDYHLATMIAKGMNDTEIADRLENETCFDPFFEQALDWSIYGLSSREENPLPASTSKHVRVSGFVRENFSKHLLAHTYNHPTGIMYDYIINQIAEKSSSLRKCLPRKDTYGIDPHPEIAFPVARYVQRRLDFAADEPFVVRHLEDTCDIHGYIEKSRPHYESEGAEKILGAVEVLSTQRPWFKPLLDL